MALAARALAGALGGLGPAVDQLADDCAHEAIDDAALRRSATDSFDRSLAELEDVVGHGMFLREEALRHWQDYVGADDVTRIFSRGIGAVRGMIASIFRPSTAPVAEVREAATDDLLSLARQHAAEASRRTAAAWTQRARRRGRRRRGPDAVDDVGRLRRAIPGAGGRVDRLDRHRHRRDRRGPAQAGHGARRSASTRSARA